MLDTLDSCFTHFDFKKKTCPKISEGILKPAYHDDLLQLQLIQDLLQHLKIDRSADKFLEDSVEAAGVDFFDDLLVGGLVEPPL